MSLFRAEGHVHLSLRPFLWLQPSNPSGPPWCGPKSLCWVLTDVVQREGGSSPY